MYKVQRRRIQIERKVKRGSGVATVTDRDEMVEGQRGETQNSGVIERWRWESLSEKSRCLYLPALQTHTRGQKTTDCPHAHTHAPYTDAHPHAPTYTSKGTNSSKAYTFSCQQALYPQTTITHIRYGDSIQHCPCVTVTHMHTPTGE